MTHSYAHISELAYQAVRRAILPEYPRPRDKDGRYVSRVDAKAAQLRGELANNGDVQDAIERVRA